MRHQIMNVGRDDRLNTLRLRTERSQYSFSVLSIFLEAQIKYPVHSPRKLHPFIKLLISKIIIISLCMNSIVLNTKLHR